MQIKFVPIPIPKEASHLKFRTPLFFFFFSPHFQVQFTTIYLNLSHFCTCCCSHKRVINFLYFFIKFLCWLNTHSLAWISFLFFSQFIAILIEDTTRNLEVWSLQLSDFCVFFFYFCVCVFLHLYSGFCTWKACDLFYYVSDLGCLEFCLKRSVVNCDQVIKRGVFSSSSLN